MKRLLFLFLLIPCLLFSQTSSIQSGDGHFTGKLSVNGAFTAGSGSCSQNITATLYVSPDGDDSDGSTFTKAYTTIQAALDAASTDANDLTLILVAPHATYYDIDTTGDPTWTGNYEIAGTHRRWSAVRNEHNNATSIFKFTGKVSLTNLALSSSDNGIGGSVSGVIFTNNGFRVRKCGFNSQSTTHANKSIHIDGSGGAIMGGRIQDVEMLGTKTVTTGIYLNNAKINTFDDINIHTVAKGLQIINADSDNNYFNHFDVGDATLALDIDAGNGQHFNNLNFHINTTNVDDEVGDHVWTNIHGQFAIAVLPDDFTGIAVDTGDGADAWSGLITVYTHTGSSPFRVIATHSEVGTTEWYRLQYTIDDGATYFDDLMFDANRREGNASPSGTEFIFNKGTVIKARSKSESAGVDGLDIWIEVQEI